MYVFPINVINKVAEESRSGMAYALTVPDTRPLHRLRAVRRLLRSARPMAAAPAITEPRSTLTLLPGAGHELCEAEVRDRGTKVAGAARAC
ncbi:hypothetical protein AB0F43_27620 [Kribbella sp. NPDC023972]|uniref:hypothetical protein n=1 Tax=Kribbella sp. NPDC023972 TaxID=3154795 RepID=UPI0033D9DC87